LIDYLLFYVPFKDISLLWRHLLDKEAIDIHIVDIETADLTMPDVVEVADSEIMLLQKENVKMTYGGCTPLL
jgi:hypothetical protein